MTLDYRSSLGFEHTTYCGKGSPSDGLVDGFQVDLDKFVSLQPEDILFEAGDQIPRCRST